MRILLHTCCGPCSTFVAQELRTLGHEVTGYFINSNIHPYDEYLRRLEHAQKWAQAAGVPLLVEKSYDVPAWINEVSKNAANRCEGCYRVRLLPTALKAHDESFDAFSTTLLISPYQQHDVIRQVGEQVSKVAGVPFIYDDFRPGFKETYELSRQFELYRQNYCGCVISQYERMQAKKQKS